MQSIVSIKHDRIQHPYQNQIASTGLHSICDVNSL